MTGWPSWPRPTCSGLAAPGRPGQTGRLDGCRHPISPYRRQDGPQPVRKSRGPGHGPDDGGADRRLAPDDGDLRLGPGHRGVEQLPGEYRRVRPSAATPPHGGTRSPGSCGWSWPTTAPTPPVGPGRADRARRRPGQGHPSTVVGLTTTPTSPLATRLTGSFPVTITGVPTGPAAAPAAGRNGGRRRRRRSVVPVERARAARAGRRPAP